jgi:hypothetical protein
VFVHILLSTTACLIHVYHSEAVLYHCWITTVQAQIKQLPPDVSHKRTEKGNSMQTTHDQTTAPPAAAAPPKRTAASLACQAGALYRKNAVYQRRAVCSNVCLLSAPLLFCCVLLAIQLTVNRLILVGPDFEVSRVFGGVMLCCSSVIMVLG